MPFQAQHSNTDAKTSHPVSPNPKEWGEKPATSKEVIGTFTGYLRRPKTMRTGLMAQFFGENGPEADTITVFHLDKFLDTKVLVTTWVIKNGDGQLMKDERGDYVQLPKFIATIKRPRSTNSGLAAQFFAENGSNADAANEMNKTKYLDNLVLVQVSTVALDDMEISSFGKDRSQPDDTLAEDAATHMTKKEKKAIIMRERNSAKALESLHINGFFSKAEVWEALGGENAYLAWLHEQACCHPTATGACSAAPVSALHLSDKRRGYGFLPMCEDHHALWNAGAPVLVSSSGYPTPEAFIETTRSFLVPKWAKESLVSLLQKNKASLPSPSAVYGFAIENNLMLALPQSFPTFLNGAG